MSVCPADLEVGDSKMLSNYTTLLIIMKKELLY